MAVVIVVVRSGSGAMGKANAVEGLAADRGMTMAAKRRMAAVAAIVASICLINRGVGAAATAAVDGATLTVASAMCRRRGDRLRPH